ncbi:small ribosomal subunit protein uS2m-like [Dysidea avara]|uniref:small ribosomal subunit protein uS2m-like n=1 Tax=Dysidea avara TaxID=196820 RepID=UPI0033267755
MQRTLRVIRGSIASLVRYYHVEPTASTGQVVSLKEKPASNIDFGVDKLTSLRELFEARVHIGHKTSMWNPSMLPYLYGHRAGIHIIDLDKTWQCLQLALKVTSNIAYQKGVILFVNERSQFERLNQKAARDSNQYFVTQWTEGTLTNMYGLLGSTNYPDLIIFTSVPPNESAVKEAAMCCVPSIGIVDSDCDPQWITYPVPGNDDTPSALQLYFRIFSDAIKMAMMMRKEMDTLEQGTVKSGNVTTEVLHS